MPAFVTPLTFMPPAPYSAAKLLLWTLTSEIMPLFNDTIIPQLQPTSSRFEPSSCAVLPDDRMPFTV